MSSSLISPALGQVGDLPARDRALLAGQCASLAEHLAGVPDPRDPRGVRHSLTSLLLAAVAAVLAGAQSFAAIGEWAADAPPRVLAALGVRYDPLARRFRPPDEATIRRVLEAVDAAALEAAVGSWLAARLQGAHPAGLGRWGRRAVAVDGKAVRGTRHASADGQARRLLAAADQQALAVLAQAEVDGKTNEITCFAPLLAPLNLAGAVVTADALHAQREHAEFLVTEKNAHYILTVKDNQPTLHARLKGLPWRQVPAAFDAREKGHGRAEWRTLKVTAVAAGIAFPHAAQAIQIRRRRRPLDSRTGRRWSTETSYAVTSLAAHQATPAQLAAWIRGHWAIEVLHHIRDVTYGEDACQIRTGSGPRSWLPCATLASPSSSLPAIPASPPPAATTPATPPASWSPSGSPRQERNGHHLARPRAGRALGCPETLDFMPAIWRLTPRQSIAAECQRRGKPALVSGCIDLLQGCHDVDDSLLLALGGPPAQAVLNGQAGGRTGYWPRVWAARGLLHAWDNRATAAIIQATSDDAWRVREMAAKVIARHRIGDAFSAAAGLRNDQVARVRAAAERAIVILTAASS